MRPWNAAVLLNSIGDITTVDLKTRYSKCRSTTNELISGLETEDLCVQPHEDVSPIKWHLGHTAWFFDQMVLLPVLGKSIASQAFNSCFNSYYQSIGNIHSRVQRGALSRPLVREIAEYRSKVDNAVLELFDQNKFSKEQLSTIRLGIEHEQQHQELMLMDIKYTLFANYDCPTYSLKNAPQTIEAQEPILVDEGVIEVGHGQKDFCFDNELPRHKTYIHPAKISGRLVSTKEYMEFIQGGGYKDFRHWHEEGFSWLSKNKIEAPLYWQRSGQNQEWRIYTLKGWKSPGNAPVMHLSFYEAAAYANWAGGFLPTEFQWEQAALQAGLDAPAAGWQWTQSDYAAYPGYKPFKGALQEYNAKFMCSQKVLRGGSFATPEDHYRPTYRNFFYPQQNWHFSAMRMAYES